MVRIISLSLALFACGVVAKVDPNLVRLLGGQAINLWKLEAARDAKLRELSLGQDNFRDQSHSQAAFVIDSEDGSNSSSFSQLFWHDARFSSTTKLKLVLMEREHKLAAC